MINEKLSRNILATIIYYDGLAYPLTAFEIWKYLMRSDYFNHEVEDVRYSMVDIFNELLSENLAPYIEHKSGFYFLKNREALVLARILANKISVKKIKRLRKSIFWIKMIPFVKMVGITGALAMKNAKISSDLDVLIVIKNGRIWTGRTILTLVAFMLGRWRHGKKISNRICLNCFITDKSLEVITKDLFSANEYMFLTPLFGWKIYNLFQIKNKWISSMKPSYALSEISPIKMISDNIFSEKVRAIGEKIFSFDKLEKWLKKIEKKRILKNSKTHKQGSLIYAADDALLFFPNPHGPLVFEKFKDKTEKIGF